MKPIVIHDYLQIYQDKIYSISGDSIYEWKDAETRKVILSLHLLTNFRIWQDKLWILTLYSLYIYEREGEKWKRRNAIGVSGYSLRILLGFADFMILGTYQGMILIFNSDGTYLRSSHLHTSSITSFASSDEVFVTGADDGYIKVCNRNFEEISVIWNEAEVYSLIIDGDFIYAGDTDYRIKKYNWRTGQCISMQTGHTNTVRALLRWNNFVLSASRDGYVKIWTQETLQFKGQLFQGHFPLFSLVASPERLYAAGASSRLLILSEKIPLSQATRIPRHEKQSLLAAMFVLKKKTLRDIIPQILDEIFSMWSLEVVLPSSDDEFQGDQRKFKEK